VDNDDKSKAIPESMDDENSSSTDEQTSPIDLSSNASQEGSPLTDTEKLNQLEKDHLYLRAELENIKRQNIKERSQLLRFGGERMARDLLDTLDVFKSALSSEIKAENFESFVKGIEMTLNSLTSVLEKHGIKEMNCLGLAFDPNTQEAISSEPTDQFPEGHVTQVFKAPYLYHDKLLRPGQVVVSRAKTD